MNNIIDTAILGTLVGVVGTGAGGIISILLVRPNRRFLSVLLGITSGLMLSIITFDLLPEALSIGDLWICIVGIILGIILVVFIEDMIPDSKIKNNSLLKTGILVGIGIALHNLPEGLAIGSGFVFRRDLGIKVALVMALHNLPEGIAMGTPLRMAGAKSLKILFLTFISGIPTGLGALIGGILGNVSDIFISLCLSLASGTMLYITCGELIPNAREIYKGRISTIGFVFGFVLGMGILH